MIRLILTFALLAMATQAKMRISRLPVKLQ